MKTSALGRKSVILFIKIQDFLFANHVLFTFMQTGKNTKDELCYKTQQTGKTLAYKFMP